MKQLFFCILLAISPLLFADPVVEGLGYDAVIEIKQGIENKIPVLAVAAPERSFNVTGEYRKTKTKTKPIVTKIRKSSWCDHYDNCIYLRHEIGWRSLI